MKQIAIQICDSGEASTFTSRSQEGLRGARPPRLSLTGVDTSQVGREMGWGGLLGRGGHVSKSLKCQHQGPEDSSRSLYSFSVAWCSSVWTVGLGQALGWLLGLKLRCRHRLLYTGLV